MADKKFTAEVVVVDKASQPLKNIAGATGGIADEAARTQQVVDKLSTSLGTEFVGGLNASGVEVDQLVQGLQDTGYSLDQIDANADEVATHLKASFATAEGGIQKVGATADKTKIIVGQMAGGAANDLARAAGATGPLVSGLQSTANYAAQGGLNFKTMAVAAAGFVAVNLVMSNIADNAKKVAETKAWKKEELEGWTRALRDGETAAEALRKKIEETGKLDVNFDFMQGFRADALPIITEAGVSLAQFSAAVTGGAVGLAKLEGALQAAGNSTEDVKAVMYAAAQQQEYYTAASAKNAAVTQFLGEQIDVTAEKAGLLAAAEKKVADEARGIDKAWSKIFDELDVEQSVLDLIDQFDALAQSEADAAQAATDGAEDSAAKQRDYQSEIIQTKREVAEYAKEVLGLPPEQVTKILADLDEGNVAAVQATLNRLSQNRTMQLSITTSAGGFADVATFSTKPPKARAKGGPVKKGETYLVGEQGPEPFVPDQNGTIVPNGVPLGGGIVVNNNVTVHTVAGDPQAIQRVVIDALARSVRQGQTIPR